MGALVDKPESAWRDLHVLVMAGGSGTRFWPKSRAKKPKQLLGLWDDKSLLQHTIERFTDVLRIPKQNIWVVTTQELIASSREVLGRAFDDIQFLGEPRGRNTAPCIYWGLQEIKRVCPTAVIAVMPADHYIGDTAAFHQALAAAVHQARESYSIVTLGIHPHRPETGFGYIEVSRPKVRPKASAKKYGALEVKKFVEKPDLKTARRYVRSGSFLWNAGMFVFSCDSGEKAFRKTMPKLCAAFDKASDIQAVYESIGKSDAVSVDYGVIERCGRKKIPVHVVPVDCQWNDVGLFTALEEIGRGVVGDTILIDAVNNVVSSDSGLVALLGVNNLVVVRSGDVTMVCSKDRAQDIKRLVELVKNKFPRFV